MNDMNKDKYMIALCDDKKHISSTGVISRLDFGNDDPFKENEDAGGE